MNTQELELLIEHMHGRLPLEKHGALNDLLRRDAEAREWLRTESALETRLRLLAVEAGVETRDESFGPSRTTPASSRWLSWRPLTAAAAGLVIGLFSTSLIFGFAGNRHFSVLTLLKEGFEDAGMPRESSVPTRVDVWAGDMLAPREASGKVRPAEGSRMATLPLVTTEKRRLSHAFRFIDVSRLPAGNPAQSRQIEVTAKFHCEKPGIKDRLQVRLAAFDESVDEAREIWLRDEAGELALMHVTKTVKTDPAVFGWNTVHAVMDLPDDARVLFISLAAGVAHGDKSKVEHYLDDVQVRLITSDMPLP